MAIMIVLCNEQQYAFDSKLIESIRPSNIGYSGKTFDRINPDPIPDAPENLSHFIDLDNGITVPSTKSLKDLVTKWDHCNRIDFNDEITKQVQINRALQLQPVFGKGYQPYTPEWPGANEGYRPFYAEYGPPPFTPWENKPPKTR